MGVALWMGACSDRQLPPDPTERIEQACEVSCPITVGCDPELSNYTSVETCVEGCQTSDRWEDLDQCDWAHTEFMICIGTLSCEQWDQYNVYVFEDENALGDDWPCLTQLGWIYDCHGDQPFEQPD